MEHLTVSVLVIVKSLVEKKKSHEFYRVFQQIPGLLHSKVSVEETPGAGCRCHGFHTLYQTFLHNGHAIAYACKRVAN